MTKPTKTFFDVSDEWRIAQIDILKEVVMRSLDGIDTTDEDLVDSRLKLQFPIQNRKGEQVRFIEEWDKLVITMKPNDSEASKRKRILCKSQLIVDLLDEVKTWMKTYSETEPAEGGLFYQKIGKGKHEEQSAPEP
jgi:hypothetical protein